MTDFLSLMKNLLTNIRNSQTKNHYLSISGLVTHMKPEWQFGVAQTEVMLTKLLNNLDIL